MAKWKYTKAELLRDKVYAELSRKTMSKNNPKDKMAIMLGFEDYEDYNRHLNKSKVKYPWMR